MRRILFFIPLILLVATIDSCVTDTEAPSFYVGMSRDRLRARFGDPIRVEATPGGEDWYYSFASWSDPDVQASGYNNGYSREASASMTFSDQGQTQERPIHFSRDGYVVDPLPAGRIVRR